MKKKSGKTLMQKWKNKIGGMVLCQEKVQIKHAFF